MRAVEVDDFPRLSRTLTKFARRWYTWAAQPIHPRPGDASSSQAQAHLKWVNYGLPWTWAQKGGLELKTRTTGNATHRIKLGTLKQPQVIQPIAERKHTKLKSPSRKTILPFLDRVSIRYRNVQSGQFPIFQAFNTKCSIITVSFSLSPHQFP